MKTIFKSEKKHWAVGHEITCKRCSSRFMAEHEYDFQDGYDSDYIYIVCPECVQSQKVYKPRKVVSPFRIETVPCTTTSTTWSSIADQMENAESQQEYFGK